jgi:hypothetical protein
VSKTEGSASIAADFLISLRADTPDSDAFNPESLLSEGFPAGMARRKPL